MGRTEILSCTFSPQLQSEGFLPKSQRMSQHQPRPAGPTTWALVLTVHLSSFLEGRGEVRPPTSCYEGNSRSRSPKGSSSPLSP